MARFEWSLCNDFHDIWFTPSKSVCYRNLQFKTDAFLFDEIANVRSACARKCNRNVWHPKRTEMPILVLSIRKLTWFTLRAVNTNYHRNNFLRELWYVYSAKKKKTLLLQFVEFSIHVPGGLEKQKKKTLCEVYTSKTWPSTGTKEHFIVNKNYLA